MTSKTQQVNEEERLRQRAKEREENMADKRAKKRAIKLERKKKKEEKEIVASIRDLETVLLCNSNIIARCKGMPFVSWDSDELSQTDYKQLLTVRVHYSVRIIEKLTLTELRKGADSY
jgi:hypothetical protein